MGWPCGAAVLNLGHAPGFAVGCRHRAGYPDITSAPADRAVCRVGGGIAAFCGLVGPPVVIMTILGVLYQRFGEIEVLRHILAGVSCAAVGLLIAVVFRMMMPLIKKRDVIGLALLAAVFVAIGLLRLPLPIVLLVAIPDSIAITFMRRRGAEGLQQQNEHD